MKTAIRHGDIHLVADSLPKSAVKISSQKSFTLALGESTGHMHTLTLDREFDVYEADGVRYVVIPVGDPGVLTHQEHESQEIPAGVYRQGQEIEYDPFLANIRQVAD